MTAVEDEERSGEWAVHCGWFIDGSGSPPRQQVVLDIASGRIRGIHPACSCAGGMALLDRRGFTVLPPLVDAHVHLHLSGRCDAVLRQRQLEADDNRRIDEMDLRIRRHFRRGILAVRDGGDALGQPMELARRQPRRLPPGFVLRTCGWAWHQIGRYGRTFGRAPEPGQTLSKALEACSHDIDHVKIIHSGINHLTHFGAPSRSQFDPKELGDAVAAAHRRGLRVMVHANGPIPVAEALAAGCDSIEHGFFMGEANLATMAARGAVWVPTCGTMAGYGRCLAEDGPEAEGARRHLDHQLNQIARARCLGVELALGTDAGSPGVRHGRGMIVEMALMGVAGFSIAETVRCAAVNGARLLGLERSGELRVGAPADFVLVSGTPEDLPGSLERVNAVVVAGRVVYEATPNTF